MEQKIITKRGLIDMLNNADDQKKRQIVGRALVALFFRQTTSEQANDTTMDLNSVGFNSSHGRKGSIHAKTFLKRGTLLDFQLEYWLEEQRGGPRITMYHRQLNEVAVANAERNQRKLAI